MSDTFHQNLSQIIKILKSSPGSITVQNIQRLSNIYKFETFIEKLNNTENLKRLSIAGKILVIDIDFQERRDGKLLVKDVKLILANNNNNFSYFNSKTNENILVNSLTKYENLKIFDDILESLSVMDNFTQDDFDLFDYYMNIYEYLKSHGAVILNYNNKFEILFEDKFKIGLINDDSLSLSKITNDFRLDKIMIKEVGLIIETTKVLFAPKDFLDIITLSEESVSIFNANDIYKCKKSQEITLQGFEFYLKGLVWIKKYYQTNLLKLPKVFTLLLKYDIVIEILSSLKEQFNVIDKFEELENEDLIFQEFQEKNEESVIDSDQHFITISSLNESVEFKSDLEILNAKFHIDTEESLSQFNDRIIGFKKLLLEYNLLELQ